MNVVIPFGRYRGESVTDLPGGYLSWLTTCKLSAGLRAAVVAELTRRGIPVPDAPPAGPRTCRRCPGAPVHYGWQQCRNGVKRVRACCGRCAAFIWFPPCRPPFTTHADVAASPTGLLDVLTECGTRGIALRSDGQAVEFASHADWREAPPELRAKLQAVRHTLARMVGRGRVV